MNLNRRAGSAPFSGPSCPSDFDIRKPRGVSQAVFRHQRPTALPRHEDAMNKQKTPGNGGQR